MDPIATTPRVVSAAAGWNSRRMPAAIQSSGKSILQVARAFCDAEPPRTLPPLARRLAELHGGSLHVDSEKGRGTTITVSLPATCVMAQTPAPPIIGAQAGVEPAFPEDLSSAKGRRAAGRR